ncbi:hypothetical protein AQUCO_05400012v1 [Aquilegia coerulea]|uniref:Protein kinase domain-containing protein n=1 Tax=Aquilegia coerulea TaxID=218851 RepID=A0A2G5CH66_AQUCA|nr:hypothetical protein AQUCO_05400012v1 [Aquilegia coerulea]PIA30625.1 hypothetical protein AQUCO_05400012v1 [Aquilegia coerulea]
MNCSCFGALVSDRNKDPAHSLQHIDGALQGKIKLFTYNELSTATNNFHASNKLGRGGFGTVYKGILKNGIQVAVKALSAESKQGVNEFLTEIDVVTNVKHPNLVELIGCCVQGNNRILVYEYVENNSLDQALLGRKSNKIKLDWGKRIDICLGTARGLKFLHEELEPPIVHRDIKASNILLAEDFAPKIGDFGLAKFFPENITHISTRVAGTTGYLAPEYALRGQLTKKADVYSFGVLILEIVSGRSSAKENWGGKQKVLLEWTWELYNEKSLLELVDPDLEEYPEDEVVRFIKVALFCSQAAANRRPSMNQVVAMLSKNIRLNEKELTAPGFFEDADLSGKSSTQKKMIFDSTSRTINSFPDTITEIIPR